ncbi:MAG: NAD(P)/FAD-dependent oxidoreductase [Chryseotalea sp.]
MLYDVVIVGGGAAGFFAAIEVATAKPTWKIVIVEKTPKLLTKVSISGGGRCNVTHHCFEAKPLSKHYPRGEKTLRQLFQHFQAKDVVAWFEKRKVKLKTEEDGRMFPVTDSSETIVQTFLQEAAARKIEIRTKAEVSSVIFKGNTWQITINQKEKIIAKKVLIAIGGNAGAQHYDWLKDTGHTIKPPIPSLFTFNEKEKRFKELMGISVAQAEVKIEGSKFAYTGPLLITHWGLSGPAVIKLSAWAAEYLFERKYTFYALVNWTGTETEQSFKTKTEAYRQQHPKQIIAKHPLFNLPQRLWEKLCEEAAIEPTKIWSEIALRQSNKLMEQVLRCRFSIMGKTTFKEDFVTCGGIPLSEIELPAMQSKVKPNLFFAGEVLDIDGETGGFNFQSAWTTAYMAAQAIAQIPASEG